MPRYRSTARMIIAAGGAAATVAALTTIAGAGPTPDGQRFIAALRRLER
jgi:hypothetical protein